MEERGDLLGRVVAGKYAVQSIIGQGAMGVVYRAKQVALDKVVALKVLSDDVRDDPEFVLRFHTEVARRLAIGSSELDARARFRRRRRAPLHGSSGLPQRASPRLRSAHRKRRFAALTPARPCSFHNRRYSRRRRFRRPMSFHHTRL